MSVSRPRKRGGVDAVIKRGGAPTASDPGATHPMTLRLPETLVRDLDAHLQALPYRMSRTAYILQAIHQQLERDRGGSG